MAESTSRKPFWITLFAAVITVVVVLGATIGPTVIGCFGNDEGFGQCARQRLADVGLLRRGASPINAPEQTRTADAEPTEPEVVTKTAEVTIPKATTPKVEETIAPSLGLVRAEPDGSTVIAGSAEPGVDVEIYASGELIGSTIAEKSGDWVVVPDAPLPTGGVEITVETPASGQVADQSVVVVVQEDLFSEPLVVASTPGEASQVLQGLTNPEPKPVAKPSANTEAVVPTPTDAQPATQQSATPVTAPQTAAKSDTPAEPAAAPAVETATAEVTDAAPQVTAPKVTTPKVDAPQGSAPQDSAANAETPKVTTPVVETAVVSAPETTAPEIKTSEVTPPETKTPEVATPTTPTPTAKVEDVPVVEEAPIVVAVAPPAEAVVPTETAPLVMPTIDAIEIDGDQNFFAGSGTNGSVIRLYVDDQFIADTVVDDGRWLVQTDHNVLGKTKQRVRIDMLKPGSADVVARAEVNFEIALPETPEAEKPAPTAVAQAQPAEQVAKPETAVVAEQAAAPATTQPEPTPTKPTPAQTAPVAAQDAPEPATMADTAVATATADTQPKAPATANKTVTAQPAASGSATLDDDDVPTLTAVQIGDPEDQRFASGKAIIRRGDNLWTIARRVYGEGLRYTTIYLANKSQIRDPDLIFPGQIFDLPKDN